MELVDFLGPRSLPIRIVLRSEVHSPPSMDSSSSCVSYWHDHEKKPIGDHLRSEVNSPPSMDSSSWRLSYLHDQEDHEKGGRDISDAEVAVARVFFPLTPDQNTKEVGGPRREIFPAQPKRKSLASFPNAETLIVEKKAKYKGKKEDSGCDTEEVSTELVLFFDPYKIKKKLTPSNLPRGDARSLSLMDSSSSCVSYLHDQEKDCDERAKDISDAGVVVPCVFFPLTPDQNTKEVSSRRQEIVPAQLKRKSKASLADAETLIVEKKAKYKRTQKGKKEASGCDTEEVSTELALLFDPYKIKKKLTQSDLGHHSRLMIGRDFVMSHVLRWMSEETVRQVESGKGAEVIVRDVDTCSEHRLVFVFWASSRSFVLNGGWIKEFVKRRELEVGDEVGIYWDPTASKFHFSLLHMVN
ncbi:hypothetical protein BT93_F0561 [Corymbia citriodora subsp. variegata]|nr:hypothetical protein BT93_F0561 [Corymbia citriodora subsp. variegata]